MKSKVVIGVLSLAVLSMTLMPVQKVVAFWPFDFLFSNNGKVMGEQTQKQEMTPKLTPPVAKITGLQQTGTSHQGMDQVIENNDEKLIGTVNASKLTEAKKLEFKGKMAEIRIKREEMRKLELVLLAWLKENKIDPKFNTVLPTPTPEVRTNSTTKNVNEVKYLNPGTPIRK
jgi:hypothetical protein